MVRKPIDAADMLAVVARVAMEKTRLTQEAPRIVVVDDERAFRTTLVASLEDRGYQVASLVTNIGQVVVASDRAIRMGLLSLFSEGHTLVEDLPGVGKTLLAKTIARSIGAEFSRIQFTPDLLPTDITGSTVYNLTANQFDFVPGPVFANVVLADELNRAGPRTQSALLEAMGEHQVTADGTTHRLPRPFFVIATQNLAETHGIFPLPNSQLDRFSISMRLGFPSRSEEMDILARSERGLREVDAVTTPETVAEMQATVRQVAVAQPVREYLLNVLEGCRKHVSVQLGPSPEGRGRSCSGAPRHGPRSRAAVS